MQFKGVSLPSFQPWVVTTLLSSEQVDSLFFHLYILNKNNLVNNIWDNIENVIFSCLDKHPTIIIGGDLNASMGPNDHILFNQFKIHYKEAILGEPLYSGELKDLNEAAQTKSAIIFFLLHFHEVASITFFSLSVKQS